MSSTGRQENPKQQIKQSIRQQTQVFQTQALITIEHDCFFLSSKIKLFLIIIGNLQTVSFLITPTRSEQQLTNTIDTQTSMFMNLIPLITRPHTFLTEVGNQAPYGNFRQLLFFIVLGWILLTSITLVIMQIHFKRTDRKYKHLTQFERIQQLSFPIQLLIYFISWSLQMLNVILIVPALELSLESLVYSRNLILQNNLEDQSQNYAISIFAVLTVILLFLINILRFLITEETITLSMRGNEKLNLTVLEIFLFMLKSGQVLIFIFIPDQSIAIYLQIICAICITIITVVNLLVFHSQWDVRIINIILITQSFNTSLIIVYLITHIAQIYQDGLGVILLNFGFLASIILRYKLDLELLNMQPAYLKKIDDPVLLQYQIARNLLDQQQYKQNSNGILFQTIIVTKHRQICVDVDCFCKKVDYQVDDPERIIFSNDQLQKEYTMVLLKKLNKCQKKVKNDYDKFSFILHYIAALSLIGMNTQAFQQTNVVLYKSKKSKKNNIQANALDENSQILSMMSGSQSASKSQSDKHRENMDLKVINERQRKQLKSIQVTNIENLTFIQRQKLKILQTQIQQKINQNVTSNNEKKGDAEDLTHAVNLFLDSENNNQKLKIKVVKLMQMKLQFYDFLTSSKTIDGGIIFHKSQMISQKLYSTEEKLKKLYQDFPSQKIQSVICFFQAEIFNNYLEAYKISSVTKIADEKLMKMNQNLAINLFSNKITFLILALEEQNLVISQSSNNAHEFFQYNQTEFRSQLNVDFLLPPAIKKEHNIVVNEFLQTGRSKFFRNQSLNFCIRKDQFITPIEFFYDINFSNLGNFSFAAFFEQITSTSAYIMLDLNGYIGGVSRNLFEKMGLKNQEIKQFDVKNLLYYTHITKIIPKFDEMVDNNNSTDHQIQNINYIQSLKYPEVHALFLKSEVLKKNYYKQQNTMNTEQLPKQKVVLASVNHMWSQKNLQEYQLSCIININAIVGMKYYIIEIEEIKQIRLNMTSNQTTQYFQLQGQTGCTSNNFPMRDEDKNYDTSPNQNQEIELDEINWSKLIEPDKDISIEKEINTPQVLQIMRNDLFYNEDYQEGQYQVGKSLEELKIFSPNHSQSGIMFKSKDESQQILSPDDQTQSNKNKSKFNNQNMIQRMQQKFYLDDKSQSLENSSKFASSINDNKLNQLVQYDVQGIDEEFKRNILQMLQEEKGINQNLIKLEDNNGSQASSIDGVRKSPFFKKYDMVTKVINSKNNPQQIIAMNAFLAIKLILICVFSIIIKTQVQTDLQRFLQEIDILQITNHFLAPFVQFTVERLAILRYDGELTQGLISKQTRDQYVPYNLQHVISDYDTMKNNYVLQFSNVYLQGFFKNQYIVIIQGLNASNVTQVYNVTLRTSLEILLEFVYLFKLSYQGILSRPQLYKGPSLFYQYKNIIPLMSQFESLSQQILIYTTGSTVIIQQKFYNIWLPFFVLAIIFTLIAWVCFKMYYRKLEQLMTMFKYVTAQSIERDKDRYKLLLNFLNRDSNLIFKYQFNLQQKEKILYLLKQKKGEIQKHQNERNQNVQINKNLQSLKLPILKSILVFSSMLSIFLITSTIINIQTQIYLNKYQQTAKLFKQFSDLGFYLPNLFLSREQLYNWNTITPFLNSDDKQKVYNQINLSYQNVDEFIKLMNFFNPDLYLLTDTFIQQFQKVKTQSLCNFLEPNLTISSQYYCQNSFQGVLQRGLVITLNTFQARFHTEQLVNNFTVRSEGSDLQIEAEFITQKVTEFLKTNLKIGLVSLTQDHIAYIQNLCIFLFIFSLAGVIFIYTLLSRRLRHEYMIHKRSILLMPTTSLFFDDQFERQVRLILVKENIV